MIELQAIHLAIGSFRLRDVSLSVPTASYAVLMGRTGCGKTTLLEAVCGLRRVEQGSIRLAGRDVTHLKPGERGIGYVPQDGALFDTMTVRDNLAFALQVRQWARRDIEQRVAELADMLGITHLLDRATHGLSGGEVQRTALGRALAPSPEVLCMDEPLSALDADTRTEMHALLRDIQATTHVTTLHVTHDRDEADALADVRLELADGVVRRINA